MNEKINGKWERLYAMFRRDYPSLAKHITYWYPSSYITITLEDDQGNVYSYCLQDLVCRKVYKKDTSIDDTNDDYIKKNFIKCLKDCMYKHGIQQTELEKRTGISRRTLSRYINGTSTPDICNLRKIAHALRCSTDELVYGTNDADILDQVDKTEWR